MLPMDQVNTTLSSIERVYLSLTHVHTQVVRGNRDWSEMGEFLGSVTLTELGKEGISAPEALSKRKFLKKVSFKAPLALAAIENLTITAAAGDHEAGLAAETAGLQAIFSSKDALEGLSSLLERRRPTFIGE